MFDHDASISDVLLGHGQSDDSEFFEFLENDMPCLFPEITKELETKEATALSTESQAVSNALSCGNEASFRYPSSSASACSSPNGRSSPTTKNFVPISPLSAKGTTEPICNFSVPNPLAPAVPTSEDPQCVSPSAEIKIVPAPVSPSPSVPSLEEPAKKKRRMSSCSVVSTSTLSTNASEQLNEAEIEEEKRQRNRDHARRSRLKKKNTQLKLQESLLDLKDENEQLRKVVEHIFGREENIDEMVQEHVNRPQLNFILALQNPGNRVLNSKTIQVIRSRSKKVKLNYLKTSDQTENEEACDA